MYYTRVYMCRMKAWKWLPYTIYCESIWYIVLWNGEWWGKAHRVYEDVWRYGCVLDSDVWKWVYDVLRWRSEWLTLGDTGCRWHIWVGYFTTERHGDCMTFGFAGVYSTWWSGSVWHNAIHRYTKCNEKFPIFHSLLSSLFPSSPRFSLPLS